MNGIGAGTGSGGAIDVIIPPKGGHGSSPQIQMGGFRVMINTSHLLPEGSRLN